MCLSRGHHRRDGHDAHANPTHVLEDKYRNGMGARHGVGEIPTRYRKNPKAAGDTWTMRFLLVALAITALTAGCGSATTEGRVDGDPIVITSSDLGDPESWADGFAEDSPTRIVSLASGVGETLIALGAQERIVGRDETSDIPALSDVPIVTKAHSLSAERVLALNPDLVIVDDNVGPPEALDQLRASGVRIVDVPPAWTLADIEPRTRAIADAIGATGLQVPNFTSETAGSGPRVAFLYLRGPSAIYLLGGQQSGADALIAAAGGIDVGAEAGHPAFLPLTAEALVAADPDVLLVMTKGLESVGGIDGLVELPGVAQTTAARERAVIAVDDGVLLSFGPRTGELVAQLRSALDRRT
jgi:iron complex transport system substrate-binding protein